ncbi:hypothetical protein [Halospeciosus flavus]|uniref:hypothetical protein n=1 Tax=Halospeciosus flavus TaxID=3032283 RepID=UPI0036060F52
MAEDDREWRRIVLVSNGEVGVAHADAGDANKDLVGSGVVDLECLDLEGPTLFIDDGCINLHVE